MGTKDRLGVAAAVAFAIAGLDKLFDWIGRSTAPEDAAVFAQRLRVVVSALNTIPWIWPTVGIVLLVAWAFWPKPQAASTASAPPITVISEPPAPRIEIKFDSSAQARGEAGSEEFHHVWNVRIASAFKPTRLVFWATPSEKLRFWARGGAIMSFKQVTGGDRFLLMMEQYPAEFQLIAITRGPEPPQVGYEV